MNYSQIRGINLNRKQIMELNENLFKKIKNDLKNKYYNLIRDKHYDINAFNKVIKNEILKFKFHINPFYNNIFGLIEKKFLEELTKNLDYYNRGLFYPQFIERIMDRNEEIDEYENYQFDKSICFSLGKVTLRNIIENEKILKPVDKYKKKISKEKKKSKTDIMFDYNKSIVFPSKKNMKNNK
jgi:methionine synthase II (cobalamin-independent)